MAVDQLSSTGSPDVPQCGHVPRMDEVFWEGRWRT